MKTVCDVLGVARSALAVTKARSPAWQNGRRARYNDHTDLAAAIQEYAAVLPTYGYCRVWTLLRRGQEMSGAPCVNVKRVYRVMLDYQLLLRRPVQRRDTRRRDGQIPVDRSDVRWC
jgi:putative transposase